MKKIKILISCILITAALFTTGCSGYVELENKVREGKNYKDPNQTSPPVTIPEDKSGFFNIGDTILFEWEKSDSAGKGLGVLNQMEYTVDNAKVYNSLEEANLSASDIVISSMDIPDADIPDLEEPLSENGSLGDGNKLILADVTIKNINFVNENEGETEDDINISILSLMYAGTGVYKGFNLSERNWQTAYFSAHGDVGKYNHYNLPVGETKSVKIGWIVDSDMIDFSKICLLVGFEFMPEYQKYIDLKLS